MDADMHACTEQFALARVNISLAYDRIRPGCYEEDCQLWTRSIF